MTLADRPRITHVAIRFRGETYSLPPPNRHHNVIWHIVETTGVSHVDASDEDQGFIDSVGRYLTRRQALTTAHRSGQLLPRFNPNVGRAHGLFSEDVW